MALLEVRDVSKRFPGVQALTSVSLDVEAGEVLALVGQNGAGKSTLVKIISGAQAPDEGVIVFDGRPITTYSPIHANNLGITVVYQRQQLVPWLSVAENMLMGQLPARLGIVERSRANEAAAGVLRRMRVEINPSSSVARLSPAQRQEVAIAKALYRRAKLIILDEPTAALDAEQIDRLFRLVDDLNAEGVAVLYISHHLEEVFRLADRVTILRDSRVVTTQETTSLTQGEVITLMAGRKLERTEIPAQEEEVASAASDGRQPLLHLREVTSPALHNISLSIEPGEVIGITGVIGAGGHHLAQVLFGLEPVLSGDVQVHGRPYSPSGPKQAIERGVFLVPEDPTRDGLVPYMSVATNITLVDLSAITRFGMLQLGEEREAARDYVREMSIRTPTVGRAVRNLSGGNQQKVLLAKALQAKADLLILEEPTQGVDVHAKEEIHRLVRGLAGEGKGILTISTDIRDLLLYVDRLVVVREGRVVAELSPRDTDYAEVLDLTVGGAVAS